MENLEATSDIQVRLDDRFEIHRAERSNFRAVVAASYEEGGMLGTITSRQSCRDVHSDLWANRWLRPIL